MDWRLSRQRVYQTSLMLPLLQFFLTYSVFDGPAAAAVSLKVIEDPQNTTVLVGQSAKLTCMLQGSVSSSIQYSINGTAIRGEIEFVKLAVIYNTTKQHYQSTITVDSRANNTVVKCIVLAGQDLIETEAAYVKVIGPPLPPAPVVSFDAGAKFLIVKWEKPFSDDFAQIEGYQIKVYSEDGSLKQTLNITDNLNNHLVTSSFDAFDTQECESLTFNVTATNAAGVSSAGSTVGGHPIALPQSWADSKEKKLEITFLEDTEQLQVKIYPPYMCSYQEAEYEIMFKDQENRILQQNYLRRLIYGNGDPFTVIVNITHMESFLSFFVELMVRTIDLESTVTYIMPYECCDQTIPIESTPTIVEPDNGNDNKIYFIITGTIVGAILMLLVAIGLVCTCIIGAKQRMALSSQVKAAEQAMVDNQIYEHYYESIPNNQSQIYSTVHPYAMTDVVTSPCLLESNNTTHPTVNLTVSAANGTNGVTSKLAPAYPIVNSPKSDPGLVFPAVKSPASNPGLAFPAFSTPTSDPGFSYPAVSGPTSNLAPPATSHVESVYVDMSSGVKRNSSANNNNNSSSIAGGNNSGPANESNVTGNSVGDKDASGEKDGTTDSDSLPLDLNSPPLPVRNGTLV